MTIEGEADTRRKEAADWFARLNQRKVSTDDVKGFSAWRRDPANARAFDQLQTMWEAAGALGRTQEVADLTEAAKGRGQTDRRPKRRLQGLAKPVAVLGAVVVACVATAWVWETRQPDVYATEVGERRIVRLDDGSHVTLDTASRVSVRYTRGERAITLVAGQAQFEVQRDPSRPFTVRAGRTEVTAVGTTFDVRRFGDGARVVLVEGRVAVSDQGAPDRRWALSAGQQVMTTATRPAVSAANIPSATSWTTGRLVFERTPIASAVAEVNRYSPAPIELRDPGISTIEVSGVFNSGDTEGFIAALQDLYPLQAERLSDGRVILTRAS
ncbi:FecR domain-containing protein [Brevundimonas sp.]|uniref:FecR family protein n=1 Tax=Brevundimonas sp. TaxID=1871086 RepID=UPI0028A1F088|nr:FecR domain-containing protein [Brevundimonas sp.]